ncbi:MAG: glycosyltransferase [Candidatus Omnitrophica bacterium]|jgi:cellulose synthase/poly-beta-1,6-N-acetylglucosamine synthase-like glycosyltransferase|nr:glycosyltransferase [Candidatus Omnitrophota bacterium]
MTVSIIIAVKNWQKNLEDCVGKCLELDYPDFEILILPDKSFIKYIPHNEKTSYKIIPTGPVSPADKRDMALEHAEGEILAFIDDDAYPAKDWLKNAVENFKDANVAAVGGPAITPPEDSFSQVASGIVYSSMIVSGNFTYRYLPKKRGEIDDYPSCNLLVRKSVMTELGGFNTEFWPGEDTKLCLDIVKKLKKKIIYEPTAIVYHHRRPLFSAHLDQISSYALHRGYFVKRYPETSLKLAYFLPTILLASLVGGAVIVFYSAIFANIYFTCIAFYLSLVAILGVFSIPEKISAGLTLRKKIGMMAMVSAGIVLSHLYYGFYFLFGLLSPKLKEENIV